MTNTAAEKGKPRQPADAGYVIARAVGFGLIWVGVLLLAAATIAQTLAQFL